MLVLTFLHDRWYVSWLVLTVSGGACNVSSIQYTARIPGSIQPVYPQYVECGVSCLCAAPHPCTTRQPLAGRLAKMNSPGCRVLGGVQGGGVVLSVTIAVARIMNTGTEDMFYSM